MKTRILIAFTLALAIVLVALYRGYTLSKIQTVPFVNGKHEEVVVRIPKGTWSYEPNNIHLERGEVFTFTIINEDDIPHGFAVDTYGVNETIPPHEERTTRSLACATSGALR